jgi:hypothetical protein
VIPDEMIDLLYDEVRCGMYHAGMTGPRVEISAAPGIPLIGLGGSRIVIDPHQVVGVLGNHFSTYVVSLLNPANTQLRANFRARFDAPA